MKLPDILVVRGDPPIDTFLVELLGREGFKVVKADEGETALKTLDQFTAAVALVPEKLPDMDGMSFVQKLTLQSSDIRIIMVNSHPQIERAREALLAGVYDYITWPITDTAALMSLIQRAVNEFVLMQRNRKLLQQVQSEVIKEDVASQLVMDRRTKELLVLRTISTDLSTIMEVPRILRVISNNLPQLFEYSLIAVLVEVDGKWQMFLFIRGTSEAAFVEACIENLLTLHSMFVGRPCTRRDIQVCQVNDVASPPGQGTLLHTNSELKSNITFPLVAGGETLGSISLCSQVKKAFTAMDVQVFSLISYQLASSLYNAKLFYHTQKISITDHLTGLYNRRHFDELLDHEYFRAHRYKRSLSLALVDIDHFKQINDTLGHPSGDLVLQQISNLFRKSIREVDIVARYGGEEFSLLLPDTSLEQAAILIERLRLSVQSHSFVTARHKIFLTVSAGVAALEEEEVSTKEVLVHRADESLLMAKRCGRNRVCLYYPQKGVVEAEHRGHKEQRRFPRIPVRLPVRYIQIPEDKAAAMDGISYDISVEGISFEAKELIPKGSFVILDLTLSSKDKDEQVRMLGNVIWSHTKEEGEKVVIGARFVPLSSEYRCRIEQLVEEKGEEGG